jgi:hypothetical protein
VTGKKRGEQQCLKPMKTINTVPEVREIFNRICQALKALCDDPRGLSRKSSLGLPAVHGNAAVIGTIN